MSIAAIAVVAAVFAGAVCQRLSGIGFSLIAAPALTLISGPRSGVTLTNLLAIVVASAVFATSARRVGWAKARILLPAGLVGVVPGIALSRLLPPAQLQVAVGIITALGLGAVLLASRLVRQRQGAAPLPDSGARPVTTGCAGLASGFCAGAAGAGGPALTVYAVATSWPQTEFAATGQLSYATQGAAALAFKGFPPVPGAWLGAAVAAALCGLLAGHFAARWIDGVRARRAAVVIAGVMALVTVVKGLLS